MTRLAALAPLVALALGLALGACSLDPEKQWYKPTGNYSAAEFERDTKACTKDRVLNEDCLRDRGWVPLSGDITPKVKEKPPAGSRY